MLQSPSDTSHNSHKTFFLFPSLSVTLFLPCPKPPTRSARRITVTNEAEGVSEYEAGSSARAAKRKSKQQTRMVELFLSLYRTLREQALLQDRENYSSQSAPSPSDVLDFWRCE